MPLYGCDVLVLLVPVQWLRFGSVFPVYCMEFRLERLNRNEATAQEPRALILHISTSAFPVVSRQLSALSRADPVRRTHWTGIVTLPGVTLFHEGKGGKLFQVLGEAHNNDEKCSIFILRRHLVFEGDSRDCNKEPVLSRFRDFTRVSRCRDPRELPKITIKFVSHSPEDDQSTPGNFNEVDRTERKHTTAGEPDVRYGSVCRYGTADEQAGAGNSNSESAAKVGLTDLFSVQ
ncbi:hypothetical protein J6590_090318 [Homalodisca vitripennis]|nr:hypothetical protein J6590_090318 [Homalodisca vitripennis]